MSRRTPPEPGTARWSALVTASKVAAIVGASPWDSPWSMWHRMSGDLAPDPDNAARLRGRLLEPVVLAWWAHQHPDAAPLTEQPWYPLGDWGGATPDAYCADDGRGNACLVEAKTAADPDLWGDEGTDEIPEPYLIQTQWAMGCSAVDLTYMPVLTGRLQFREYVIQYDAELFAWLKAEAKSFHESLTHHAPPALDDTLATLATLRRIHPDIDPDATVALDAAVADELVAAKAAAASADARWRLAQSTVLHAMGAARYAEADGRRVARRQPTSRGGIALHVLKETA